MFLWIYASEAQVHNSKLELVAFHSSPPAPRSLLPHQKKFLPLPASQATAHAALSPGARPCGHNWCGPVPEESTLWVWAGLALAVTHGQAADQQL